MKKTIAAFILTGAFAASAAAAQTETKIITVDGSVVRYEPGRLIVLRGADNREVSYVLTRNIVVPEDVKEGKRVTLYTEPSPEGGLQTVTRVVTTSITPEGNVKKVTEQTRTQPSGATTTTTTTQISGRVETYVPGRTLTVTRADGTKATYIITASSQVPSDLGVGRTIALVPMVNEQGELVVRTISYVIPKN